MNIREEIQSQWLATLQNELGVLSSNNLLKDLIIADLETRISNDQALIEALKKRALEAEEGNRELKETIHSDRAELKVLKEQNNTVIEQPEGLINGSNRSFFLSHDPKNLMFYLNGYLFSPDIDYDISDNEITMKHAPLSGDILRAFYTKY